MLVVCTEKHYEERRQLLHDKMAFVSQGHFPEDHLANCVKYVLQLIQNETGHPRLSNNTNVERSYIFKSYSGSDLEPDESEGGYTIRISPKFTGLLLRRVGSP